MVIDKIALALAIIGALNWGGIGLFGFDTVAFLCGGQMAILSRIIYALVGLAGLWCITLLFRSSDEETGHARHTAWTADTARFSKYGSRPKGRLPVFAVLSHRSRSPRSLVSAVLPFFQVFLVPGQKLCGDDIQLLHLLIVVCQIAVRRAGRLSVVPEYQLQQDGCEDRAAHHGDDDRCHQGPGQHSQLQTPVGYDQRHLARAEHAHAHLPLSLPVK